MKKFSSNIQAGMGSSDFSEKYSDFEDILNIESPLKKGDKLAKKQLNKLTNLLEFLRDTTIEQSNTAKKQSRNNLYMTVLALVFAFISIIPIVKEWIYPDESKKLYQNIFELQKQVSSESTRNLEMYRNLLDLENQVKNLEKQNELLLKNKSLKK